MKRSFILAVFLFLLLILMGCTDLAVGDYEAWRNSAEAEDLNGDRKIDEADYALYLLQDNYDTWKVSDEAEDLNDDQKIDEADYDIYLENAAYEAWRNSDEAEDLNGDRKIDRADYDLSLNPIVSDYDNWKISSDATDLNDDGTVNELDYALFLLFSEFIGDYVVANYSFDGSEHIYVGNKIYLSEFGQYLEQITFSIDNQGEVNADIPSTTIAAFGDSFPTVLEGLNNMNITRLSGLLVSLDTSVTIDDIVVNVSLYLTQIENGFRTTYVLNFDGDEGTISFDLIKE